MEFLTCSVCVSNTHSVRTCLPPHSVLAQDSVWVGEQAGVGTHWGEDELASALEEGELEAQRSEAHVMDRDKALSTMG